LLAILLIGTLTLAFDTHPAKAAGIIYIRANGSIEPSTARILTTDKVTYIFTGSIYDPIVVERSNIIIDGKWRTLQGDGSGNGFTLSSISNVTIKKTYISGFYSGINFESSSNSNISGNIITANSNGIWIHDSSNHNVISGNTIITNNGAGILLISSPSQNSVSGNNMTNNYYGIYVSSSNNNSISGNSIKGSSYHGVILDSSSNISLSGNIITSNNNGIRLTSSSNNTLRNNVLTSNKYNFDVWGLTLIHFMNDVDISNTVDGKPIYYWINKQDTEVPTNAGYVALVNCTHMTVQNLNLTNNGQGILLASTINSTITKNSIANNDFGIRLWYSSNNSIYHNGFVDNINQVGSYNSVNVWDDDYPSGGNYWSDYGSTDLYRGLYQNVTGSDGIGDTAYIIDANSTDNYPLMKPYAGIHDIGITNVSKSKTIVRQGDNVDISVKIVNYGINTETFNVTAYAETTVIATLTDITLASRNSAATTLTWNTFGFSKGNYTISATADTVPGETDTSDNLLIDSWVFVLSTGHDVAIRSIISRPIVGEGYTSSINVTAMNVGNSTETFNVILYINTTLVTSQNVTLESGVSTIITFTWNTSGFAKGNYTISAVAEQVVGETDALDNNCTGRWILITKVGDFGSGIPPQFFKCDDKVDGKDLSLFLLCYRGLAPSEAMYLGDLGGGVPPGFYQCDGKVEGKDLSLFLLCFKGLGP